MKSLNLELNELFYYLTEFIDRNGFSPSYREIQTALGYKSISMVKPKLLELEQLNKIKINNYKSRAIEIIGLKNRLQQETPINESIVFKILNDTFPNRFSTQNDNVLSISKTLLPEIDATDSCFILKMIGTSIVDAGIDDGDFVLIKNQTTAKTNDIVYALIEDEFTTIKKYIKKGEMITLFPANKSMKPVIPKKIKILGVIVGCLKLKF